MLYKSENSEISILLAGDTMLTRRLAVYDEERFLALAEILRSSDVTFANMEGSVRGWDEGAPGITQGTYMTTPPSLLEDLKWCCQSNANQSPKCASSGSSGRELTPFGQGG